MLFANFLGSTSFFAARLLRLSSSGIRTPRARGRRVRLTSTLPAAPSAAVPATAMALLTTAPRESPDPLVVLRPADAVLASWLLAAARRPAPVEREPLAARRDEDAPRLEVAARLGRVERLGWSRELVAPERFVPVAREAPAGRLAGAERF
jgi:hypothetical protein